MQRFRWKAALLIAVLGLTTSAFAGGGTTLQVVVHGSGLEGNLLGDSPDRTVSIYLPPGYEATSARYPVLYLLHGFGRNNRTWLDNAAVDDAADALIESGAIQPLIMVMPDIGNAYGHSFGVNSPVTGSWEDFIAKDLVAYMDAHYRTIARPESRAIAGHSAGGFTALYLATRDADTFGVVYAINPAPVGWAINDTDLEQVAFQVLAAEAALPESGPPTSGFEVLAMAAAFSPNPGRPPAYVDLPYESVDGRPRRVDGVWARWVSYSPLAMIDQHIADLQNLKGIAIDVATADRQDFVSDAEAYAQALSASGIASRLEFYEGGHNDVAPRMASALLPYVAEHVARSSDVQP